MPLSFFEKLKKGMGIEGPAEEKAEEVEEIEKIEEAITSSASLRSKSAIEERPAKKKRILKAKKIAVEEGKPSSSPFATAPEVAEAKPHFLSNNAREVKAEPSEATAQKIAEEKKGKWFETEGQLAIDVYQTETELVIQSAIAGVKPEDLDISMERDIITIRGNRQKPFEENGDYFTQECYWGPFSREAILPVEVDPDRAEAMMKEGILTIRIPKILREKKRTIKVRI